MNTFDFNALVRSMNMKDIQEALDTATKLLAEEQERERKAAEEAERKRQQEAESQHIQKVTAIANRMLDRTLTAQDMAYIYSIWLPTEFKAIDIDMSLFSADALRTHAETTMTVSHVFKNLFKNDNANNIPSIFDYLFEDEEKKPQPQAKAQPKVKPQAQPKPEDAIRNFIDSIM